MGPSALDFSSIPVILRRALLSWATAVWPLLCEVASKQVKPVMAPQMSCVMLLVFGLITQRFGVMDYWKAFSCTQALWPGQTIL